MAPPTRTAVCALATEAKAGAVAGQVACRFAQHGNIVSSAALQRRSATDTDLKSPASFGTALHHQARFFACCGPVGRHTGLRRSAHCTRRTFPPINGHRTASLALRRYWLGCLQNSQVRSGSTSNSNTLLPNPSLKLSPNSKTPGPRRSPCHHLQRGPGVLLSAPA